MTTTLGAAKARLSNVILEVRRQAPGCQVEVLTPDFQGTEEAIRMVVAAKPEILNHNIGPCRGSIAWPRRGGRYERSIGYLRWRKS